MNRRAAGITGGAHGHIRHRRFAKGRAKAAASIIAHCDLERQGGFLRPVAGVIESSPEFTVT